MENQYKAAGTVKEVKEAITFPSGFVKREIIVTLDGRFPQDLPFSFAKEKVRVLDQFAPGDRVVVDFSLAGHEHNGRNYVDLRGFRIDRESDVIAQGGDVQAPATAPRQAYTPAPAKDAPAPLTDDALASLCAELGNSTSL